jgi:hypothetical protein
VSTVKLPCGCEYTRDSRDREEHTVFCVPHKKEFDMRHAAAVASCSHANYDLVTPE